MSELLKLIGLEMQDISILLVLATAIGFILIILASRFLGRIAPFRQHRRLVWVLDCCRY